MRNFITTLNPGLTSPSVNLNIHFFAAMMKESLFFHNNGKDSRHMSLLCTFIRDYAPVSTLLKLFLNKKKGGGWYHQQLQNLQQLAKSNIDTI